MRSSDIQVDDKELFDRIAEGDGEAFTIVYKRYVPQLAAYIHTITRSESMVDEFVQETFLRLWLNRDRLRDVEEPKGWTFRIAAHICHNYLKRSLVEKKVLGQLAADSYTIPEDTAQTIQVKAVQEALKQAVEGLPPQRRKVYDLSRHGELTIPQIAEKLQLSPNTVRNTLSASLEQIRSYLNAAGYHLPVILMLVEKV